MRNHSYEDDFDLHENETAYKTHFHMKGFALRLVLKQRHKRTRKWPIRNTPADRTERPWRAQEFYSRNITQESGVKCGY